MKKYFMIALGLILTVLAGCSSQDMPDTPMNDNSVKSVKSEKQLAIERYIDRNHKSVTRGEDVALLPYVVDGDTVMYVANYPGGGFDIFSNDLALPMVLVKSNTGEYNPYGKIVKAPFDEFLAEAGEVIAENQNSDNEIAPNITWSVYSDRDDEGGGEGGMNYVGTGCEVDESEYTPKGGRLATKWNQSEPYNQYTPLLIDGSGNHSLVGCGAVAVGQYLYHSNKYFKVPVSTVTTATYNSSTNTYSFSGASSTVWNSMVYSTTNAASAKQTAIFLGYVAQRVCTKFGQYSGDGSGTYSTDLRSYLNSECGTSYTWKNFSLSTLISILSSGHPVMTTSCLDQYKNNGGVNYNEGHAYLIDYASVTEVTYFDVYADENGGGTDMDEDEYQTAYGPSMDYFYKRYGQIMTSSAGRETEYWISMNWGWGGNYDNVRINAELSSWNLYRSNDKLVLYNTEVLN